MAQQALDHSLAHLANGVLQQFEHHLLTHTLCLQGHYASVSSRWVHGDVHGLVHKGLHALSPKPRLIRQRTGRCALQTCEVHVRQRVAGLLHEQVLHLAARNTVLCAAELEDKLDALQQRQVQRSAAHLAQRHHHSLQQRQHGVEHLHTQQGHEVHVALQVHVDVGADTLQKLTHHEQVAVQCVEIQCTAGIHVFATLADSIQQCMELAEDLHGRRAGSTDGGQHTQGLGGDDAHRLHALRGAGVHQGHQLLQGGRSSSIFGDLCRSAQGLRHHRHSQLGNQEQQRIQCGMHSAVGHAVHTHAVDRSAQFGDQEGLQGGEALEEFVDGGHSSTSRIILVSAHGTLSHRGEHHHAGVAHGPLRRGKSPDGQLRGLWDVAVKIRAQGTIAEDQA
mmetsp:Transcript_54783/g.95778  ORF Transcript_54783/g.95778 Transcript_54783/m.95778 type:complete len:392 (+) Transcript_54783:1423-2598(+)